MVIRRCADESDGHTCFDAYIVRGVLSCVATRTLWEEAFRVVEPLSRARVVLTSTFRNTANGKVPHLAESRVRTFSGGGGSV